MTLTVNEKLIGLQTIVRITADYESWVYSATADPIKREQAGLYYKIAYNASRIAHRSRDETVINSETETAKAAESAARKLAHSA